MYVSMLNTIDKTLCSVRENDVWAGPNILCIYSVVLNSYGTFYLCWAVASIIYLSLFILHLFFYFQSRTLGL